MSRLTKRKKDLYGNKYIATGGGAYFEEESVYEALEKLARYEDLEEQGRLIEQKHGKWKLYGKNHYSKIWECSVCKGKWDFHTRYCPHCGAKMVKGTEE